MNKSEKQSKFPKAAIASLGFGTFLTLLLLCSGVQADQSLRLDRSDTPPELAPSFKRGSMEVRLALPDQPDARQLKGKVNDDAIKGGLTKLELGHLAAHDIVLVVDKSSSMATPDCPTGGSGPSALGMVSAFAFGSAGLLDSAASRWNWCLRQTVHMAKQTEGALANGFTVILFSSHFEVFQHVTVQQLGNIFRENHPGGHTLLAQPLAASFDDYFRRKRIGNVKPLLVGVITDGCPTEPDAAREAIISATHQVRNPNEITVIFFLIGGDDPHGERFVWDLCHNLVRKGARYPIVKAVPFNELEQVGLARALADNL